MQLGWSHIRGTIGEHILKCICSLFGGKKAVPCMCDFCMFWNGVEEFGAKEKCNSALANASAHWRLFAATDTHSWTQFYLV